MLVLFLYLLWSISYLITLIIFNVFFLKKILNKKSTLVSFLLILYFNKKLSFYKNELSDLDYLTVLSIRRNNYPTLNTIHEKINSTVNNNNLVVIKFKENYTIYKFLQKKTQLDVLEYSVYQNILKVTTNLNYSNYFLCIINSYKNSISNETLNIDIIDLTKLNNINKALNYESSKELNFFIFEKKKTINFINYLNKLISLNFNKINLNLLFINQITSKFLVNFSASNIVKYLSDLSISKSTILFLRKNKIFNKSRYSRNRQTYRTGAYWCLYINIIAVIAFYFWFYNFTMNFGYLWWLLYAFILSFFLFKAIKFNFYNLNTLKLEFIASIKWLYFILSAATKQILNLINNYFLFQKIIYLSNLYLNKKNNTLLKFILTNVCRLNDYIYNKL